METRTISASHSKSNDLQGHHQIKDGICQLCMVWCCTPTSLSQLDAVQRRAIRIIDLPEDDLISHQIQPLGTRREVGALTLFHRMYYGEAPELLCQLLPEHLQLDPRLRRSVRSHDLAVQIPRSNLVSHKRSFVPSAARIWNSLPEYIQSLEKRACFKKEVNRYFGDN